MLSMFIILTGDCLYKECLPKLRGMSNTLLRTQIGCILVSMFIIIIIIIITIIIIIMII